MSIPRSMRWGDARTMRFIKLLKRHRCLWDKTMDEYRQRRCREVAYRSMRHGMGLPELTLEDVKNKIKNLRSTYNQERKKIVQGAAEGRRYVPRLAWFHHFTDIVRLGGGSVRRGGLSSLPLPPSPPPHASSPASPASPTSAASPASPASPLPPPPPAHQHHFKFESANESEADAKGECAEERASDGEDGGGGGGGEEGEEAVDTRRVRRCRRRPHEIMFATDVLAEDAPPHAWQPPPPPPSGGGGGGRGDEFDMFGGNVAAQLRRMPLAPALRTQLAIQTLLAEERIRLHSASSPDYSP